ncbi:hypothetical protein J479_3251 [Acinetobacter baumannii 1297]|nr:hypothetical protein J479_3251 [Acinetobacter baumannii 1297]
MGHQFALDLKISAEQFLDIFGQIPEIVDQILVIVFNKTVKALLSQHTHYA